MELQINVSDYLSHDEIKDLAIEQVKAEISKHFRNEENAKRLLSNLSYDIIYSEIDKVIPNSRELVVSKTKDVLKEIKSYSVFRDRSYGNNPSLAYLIMEEAVKNNKDLLNEKVKETIVNHDYSDKIWDRFENLAESFMSNIYSIVELGRKKQ